MVSRNGDDSAHLLRIPDELRRPLEFAGARALRVIAGNRDDVEALHLDDLFDRLDLLGHGGTAEVEIGDVKDGDYLAGHLRIRGRNGSDQIRETRSDAGCERGRESA